MNEDSILYVVSQAPAPGFEAQFEEWYESEHIPELLGCPGFKSARRYTLIDGRDGSPVYLAHYEADSMAAFETPEYLAQAGRTPDNLSPLAREVIAHRTVFIQAKYRLRSAAVAARTEPDL